MTSVNELIALKNAHNNTALKTELTTLLNKGGEGNVAIWNEFNRYVEQHDNAYKIDLRDAVLDGEKLKGARFVNTNLSDATLKGDFTGTNFDGAWLTRADLSGTVLEKATFEGTEFAGADFSGASLRGAKFLNAKNEQEKPENLGKGKRPSFKGADLTNVSFQGADLHDVEWDNTTKLDGMDISGANNVPEGLRTAVAQAHAKRAMLDPAPGDHLAPRALAKEADLQIG